MKKIINKIIDFIFKPKEKMSYRYYSEREFEFYIIQQGLRNDWYKNVTAIDTIERDIEFLKSCGNSFVIKNYISRLETRIEEIKRGDSNESNGGSK